MTKAITIDIVFLGYGYIQYTLWVTGIARALFSTETTGAASVDYFRYGNIRIKYEMDIAAMTAAFMVMFLGQFTS